MGLSILRRRFLPVLALTLLFCVPVFSAGFGTLSGKVVDKKTKQPISSAVVKVQVGKGITVRTNRLGIFLFNNTVPEGKHKVTVSKRGYKNKVINDVEIKSGQNTLNVELER